MKDVTRILTAIERGDENASAKLLPLVYEELRKLASAKLSKEKPGQTLQPTMLVHEAYVRLVDVDQPQQWNGRGHFFGAAAVAMRRILVEKARQKQARKRAHSLAFSPDNRLLAAGFGGKQDVSFFELWDIDRRERLAVMPGSTDTVEIPPASSELRFPSRGVSIFFQ